MTAATITPTAIDTHVFIDSIRVIGRHRTVLRNIEALAESIADVGLINPITITGDSRLVAGERRLAACRRLGWDSVPVRIVKNLTEAARLLRAERDENTCREDMLPSEKASLGAALEEIEAAAARERQQRAGREHGRGIACDPPVTSYSGEKTREAVGEALGMHGTTYGELSFVRDTAADPTVDPEDRALAQQAMTDMDTGRGIKSTAAQLRKDLHAARVARTPQPESVPAPLERTTAAARQRRSRIAELAAEGNSSSQIAQIVGVGEQHVRTVAKEHGIRIPADEVMGKTRRIDSTRVVRETVFALEGLAMGLALVDFDAIDPTEIDHWAASLTQSMKALNRLNKRLKEMTTQ